MRPSLLTLVLAATLSANAQPVSPERADKSWKKLATVKFGQSLDVKLARAHWTCKLDTLEQDKLTCDSPGGELVFYRSEVASIKVNHRTWPWLTSPWFVVPVFSGGVGAVAAEAPHGNAIAGGVLLLLLGFVFLVRLAGG